MIKRFDPEMDYYYDGSPFSSMRSCNDGDYVKLETILDWLKEQRNDIPITGEELANGLAYECGMGKNYFK